VPDANIDSEIALGSSMQLASSMGTKSTSSAAISPGSSRTGSTSSADGPLGTRFGSLSISRSTLSVPTPELSIPLLASLRIRSAPSANEILPRRDAVCGFQINGNCMVGHP
jgi:hypothetical protein